MQSLDQSTILDMFPFPSRRYRQGCVPVAFADVCAVPACCARQGWHSSGYRHAHGDPRCQHVRSAHCWRGFPNSIPGCLGCCLPHINHLRNAFAICWPRCQWKKEGSGEAEQCKCTTNGHLHTKCMVFYTSTRTARRYLQPLDTYRTPRCSWNHSQQSFPFHLQATEHLSPLLALLLLSCLIANLGVTGPDQFENHRRRPRFPKNPFTCQ